MSILKTAKKKELWFMREIQPKDWLLISVESMVPNELYRFV